MHLRISELVAALALLALGGTPLACGDDVGCEGGDCGGSGGGGGTSSASSTSSGNDACNIEVPPPGPTFTFHIHNAGTSSRWIALGCNNWLPILLDTQAGQVPIRYGRRDFDCEVDELCELAYHGVVNTWCGDCGPGYSHELTPGETYDIVWDHRGYVDSTAPEECSGVPGGASCKLTIAILPTTMQQGTLNVCSTISFGACDGLSTDVSFTVDTTQSEATIDVM